MKKLAFLSTLALTLFCLGGQPQVEEAATKNCKPISINGNRVIFAYGSSCDNFQNIWDNLQNCLPEINLPDCNLPENDSSTNSEHAFIKQVVDLVNAERAKEGLSPLTIDTKVQAAAQVRAKECEQRFSHTRPNGSSFATALKEQNVSYRSAGENIAWGQRSPEAVMNAWMNSSGHRANIMNPNFTTIGIGYYQNANGTNYWCQLFTR